MACPFRGNRNCPGQNCRRCAGNQQNQNRNHAARTATEARETIFQETCGEQCCDPLRNPELCTQCQNNLNNGFYGRAPVRNIQTMCCDASGCSRYDVSNRNSFWPSFARPRWLNCNELYNQR